MTAKHPPRTALNLIGLNTNEKVILQMRAEGRSYRDITKITGIAPRKVWDQETSALRKLIDYVEKQAFLGVL